MSEVTRLLDAAAAGDSRAAADLLPLVYGELRRLAASRLSRESGLQTLDPTSLVHEAYLRLVGGAQPQDWDGRGHFFAAAAEAMRRILVENARRKMARKRGGRRARADLHESAVAAPEDSGEVLEVDEALDRLAATDPQAAELVKLRYFVGLPVHEAAAALGISPRSADRLWAFARAWLRRALDGR